MRFGCFLFLLPFIEVALLIQVGRWIGAWEVVGVVLGTAIFGIAMARWVGARALPGIRSEMARGGSPSRSLIDSAAILIGCVCFVVPGFLTDIVGILLLLPIPRRHLYRWIQGALLAGAAQGGVRIMTWGRGGGQGGKGGSPFGGDGFDPSLGHGPQAGDPKEERTRSGSNPERPPRPGEIIQ